VLGCYIYQRQVFKQCCNLINTNWNWLRLRHGSFTCVGWQVTLCDPIWQVTEGRISQGLYSALRFISMCSVWYITNVNGVDIMLPRWTVWTLCYLGEWRGHYCDDGWSSPVSVHGDGDDGDAHGWHFTSQSQVKCFWDGLSYVWWWVIKCDVIRQQFWPWQHRIETSGLLRVCRLHSCCHHCLRSYQYIILVENSPFTDTDTVSCTSCRRLSPIVRWQFVLVVILFGWSIKLLYVEPGYYWDGWLFTGIPSQYLIKPPRPTQPAHPSVGGRNEYWWWLRPSLGKKQWVLCSSRLC